MNSDDGDNEPDSKRRRLDGEADKKNTLLLRSAEQEMMEAAAAAAADCPSTNSERPSDFEYDVFINFRGEDTRKCFVGYLYSALKQRGIRAYLDSVELKKGESINNLFNAIERSAVFIPIFSKRYAESVWCLKEIKKIIDSKRRILPIFFDVQPTEVRHQEGTFSADFKKHLRRQDDETVNQWKEALRAATTVPGYILEKDYFGDGAKLINDVVEEVLHAVYKVPFEVAEHPVGMDVHLRKMTDVLEMEVNEVRFIGICGIGGLGKTTIAKAAFNEFHLNFEGSSFLANVRANSATQVGLIELQKVLIRDLFKDKDPQITDPSAGIQLIRKRVQGKKILVVVDDVDNMDQLHNLVGDGSRLGKGSRIIITTRDTRVLVEHGIRHDDIYTPNKFDEDQSLELFNHFAFKRRKPTENCLQLAKAIVDSIGRLPLVLKVTGSNFSMVEMEKWGSLLGELKQVSNQDVHSILRLSYDGLEDDDKEIFLDIACFFLREYTYNSSYECEKAIYMWEACKFYPKLCLDVLEQKSLVAIDKYGRFQMHDEIRDMAREIIRREDPSKPWEQSRVWKHEEALEVMRSHCEEGPGNVEALLFDSLRGGLISTESFFAMPNLRMFLEDDSSNLGVCKILYDFEQDTLEESQNESTVIHHPCPKPKWLRWPSYPYETLPQQVLNLDQLAVLELHNFNSTFLILGLSGAKEFHNLKVLDFSGSLNLASMPDFSLMPHLEKLILPGCQNLKEISPSIGQLRKLVRLNLSYCSALMILPKEMCHCTSLADLLLGSTGISELPESFSRLTLLRELDLCGCTNLSSLPRDIGNLTSLSKLSLSGTRISEFPESFSSLKMFKELSLGNCMSLKELPSTIGRYEHLQELWLSGAPVTELPKSIGQLKSLVTLNISRCPIMTLPEEICRCTSITLLNCVGCESLSSLPRDIGNLTSLSKLYLSGTGIIEIPESFSRLTILEQLLLRSCKSLKELPSTIGSLEKLQGLQLNNSSVRELPNSVGSLKNLVRLNVSECPINILPEELSGCTSLQELYCGGCKNITSLPRGIGNLISLSLLHLGGTGISEIPESVSRLTMLEILDLSDCKSLIELPSTIGSLEQLRKLNLEKASVIQLPSSIGLLKNLFWLNVSGCPIKVLPKELSGCSSLQQLDCTDCKHLSSLPEDFGLLTSLSTLSLHGTVISELPESFVSL